MRLLSAEAHASLEKGMLSGQISLLSDLQDITFIRTKLHFNTAQGTIIKNGQHCCLSLPPYDGHTWLCDTTGTSIIGVGAAGPLSSVTLTTQVSPVGELLNWLLPHAPLMMDRCQAQVSSAFVSISFNTCSRAIVDGLSWRHGLCRMSVLHNAEPSLSTPEKQ
jgi:hypothetical protein